MNVILEELYTLQHIIIIIITYFFLLRSLTVFNVCPTIPPMTQPNSPTQHRQ